MNMIPIHNQRANELHDRLLGTPYATDFEAIAAAIEWACDVSLEDGRGYDLWSERDWSNIEAYALEYLGIAWDEVYA